MIFDSTIRRKLRTIRRNLEKFQKKNRGYYNLQFFSNLLCDILKLQPNVAKINKQGYSELSFTNNKICKFLKNKALELKLPVLQRKWDRIDENYINRNEILEQKINEIKNLLLENQNGKQIAEKLKLKKNGVYAIIRKIKSGKY